LNVAVYAIDIIAVANQDHTQADCVAVVVSTIGNNCHLIGTDGDPVEFESLVEPLRRCPGLVGKPKLFFYEACAWFGVRSFFSQDETGMTLLYSQICPNGHLPLTVICVMWPLCVCPSAAHFLLKQSVLNSHLSCTATNFWSLYLIA
jgi:hypothetical protein